MEGYRDPGSLTFKLMIALLAIAVFLCIGGWKLARWFNWRFDYGSAVKEEVQEELAPLKKEIEELRQRVERLEKERAATKNEKLRHATPEQASIGKRMNNFCQSEKEVMPAARQ